MRSTAAILSLFFFGTACGAGPEGLARATKAATTVKYDFFHQPLPEVPLPNDLATRFDDVAGTGRRLNISEQAPTALERRVRGLVNTLDGWGVLQQISIPFTGDIDAESLRVAHSQDDYDSTDDAIYLINIQPDSPHFGKIQPIDIGKNNYPPVLENLEGYGKDDPRGFTISLMYEEAEEDLNHNGQLDPGEDTDMDGVLDHPNYLPGHSPERTDMPGRADALMTFYERETHTIIARPLEPLDERSRYAVVVTKRVHDASGAPVGSPFEWVNHLAQTDALARLPEVLPAGLTMDDVAFTWSYTTQSIEAPWKAVRDGLYGTGPQAQLHEAFPAEVDELLPLRDPAFFPGLTNPYVAYSETIQPVLKDVQIQFLRGHEDSQSTINSMEAYRYVDYFVVGKFKAPQLFFEQDETGAPLPYDARSWPADLDKIPAPYRSEDIYFTLLVPRKEISPRGQGKPADLVVFSHGYGGNRFDAMTLGQFFTKQGVAVLSIDGPGHGISRSPVMDAAVRGIFQKYGVGPFADALLHDRAKDLNGDMALDSGADFWTAYVFHTRDVVRQFALDYMSLIRVVRSFDGARHWRFALGGDGQPGLAGDFDGDGVIDIGGDAKITICGGSLGGMMSVVMAGLEPEIVASAPISAGGALANIGMRSTVGGVRYAMIARMMGPVYLGAIDATSGQLALNTMVPDLNEGMPEIPVAKVPGIVPGDILVAENRNNGELRCAAVDADGKVRVGLPSDLNDAHRVQFYLAGQVTGGDHCTIAAGATPKAEITTFGQDVTFQARTYAAGSPLIALAEGLGVRRGNPEIRRFQGIAQLVLDPADPAVLAKHISREPLAYAGTKQQTGAHMLLISTIGDSSVPVESGMAVARAAGLLPYVEKDPRYGKPANQVLLDWHVAESSDTYRRYFARNGNPVHADVEGFDMGTAPWAADVPHLDPPLRSGFTATDALGGRSAAIFPMTAPEGDHVFDPPYAWIDREHQSCLDACAAAGMMTCDCPAKRGYDVGNFLVNMIGKYLASRGTALTADLCMSNDSCADQHLVPPTRPDDMLH
ncbi:MAG: hypothetical protein U1E65_02830 [Myxococcota bacterium]